MALENRHRFNFWHLLLAMVLSLFVSCLVLRLDIQAFGPPGVLARYSLCTFSGQKLAEIKTSQHARYINVKVGDRSTGGVIGLNRYGLYGRLAMFGKVPVSFGTWQH